MPPDSPHRSLRLVAEEPRFGALLEALQWIAAEPDEQAAGLEMLAGLAEALHTQGAPETRLDRVLLEEGVLPPAVADQIGVIDACFAEVAEQPEGSGFTPDALRSSPLWQRMRDAARQALDTLGVPRRKPRLP